MQYILEINPKEIIQKLKNYSVENFKHYGNGLMSDHGSTSGIVYSY